MANIWARKSTAILLNEAAQGDDADGPRPLRRTLSALNLVALGIGGIIGAGIFILTGHAAAEYAGPAVTLSFGLGAVACAFAGLCYSVFSCRIRRRRTGPDTAHTGRLPHCIGFRRCSCRCS